MSWFSKKVRIEDLTQMNRIKNKIYELGNLIKDSQNTIDLIHKGKLKLFLIDADYKYQEYRIISERYQYSSKIATDIEYEKIKGYEKELKFLKKKLGEYTFCEPCKDCE